AGGRWRRLRQRADGDALLRPPRGGRCARRRAAGGIQALCRAAGDDAGMSHVSRAQRSTNCCAADPGPPQTQSLLRSRIGSAPLRFALALHCIRDTNEERLMPTERTEVLLFGPLKPTIVNGLESGFTVHKLAEA